MRKNRLIRLIIFIAFAPIFLLSCGEIFPSDGRFEVKGVESLEYGFYEYHLVSIEGRNSFFLKDSANKYIVGDTLIIK